MVGRMKFTMSFSLYLDDKVQCLPILYVALETRSLSYTQLQKQENNWCEGRQSVLIPGKAPKFILFLHLLYKLTRKLCKQLILFNQSDIKHQIKDYELLNNSMLDIFLVIFMISEWKIIRYFRSTINAYSLLSHEWWVLLIKFMVGPTIPVRGGSTHLWYSESTQ